MKETIRTFFGESRVAGGPRLLIEWDGQSISVRDSGNPVKLSAEDQKQLAEILTDPAAYLRNRDQFLKLFCATGDGDSISARVQRNGNMEMYTDERTVFLDEDDQGKLYELLGRSLGRNS